jgi:proprotein convertase subtilisin/kexin type 5
MNRVSVTSLLILTLISIANSAACPNYKYWDSATSTCLTCSYSCLTCTSSSDCSQCDSNNDHRTLYNRKACLCQTGYYDDKVSTVCKTCTSRIPNCADCFYNSTYVAADAGVGALQYGCLSCNVGFIKVGNACNTYATCPAGNGANPTTNVC